MSYIKENVYKIVSVTPLVLRTKAADDGLEISLLKAGTDVFCKSFTIDENNDTWIRNNSGWVRATRGKVIYIM